MDPSRTPARANLAAYGAGYRQALISPHSLPINPYPLHTPDNDAWCDGYNDGEDALGAMLKGLVPGGPDDVTDMED
jgi:hypothetical protein